MLLTITTTRSPATDLGWLLHKHPAKVQAFGLPFGQAHVFYPEATEERCTAALLLCRVRDCDDEQAPRWLSRIVDPRDVVRVLLERASRLCRGCHVALQTNLSESLITRPRHQDRATLQTPAWRPVPETGGYGVAAGLQRKCLSGSAIQAARRLKQQCSRTRLPTLLWRQPDVAVAHW